MAGVAESVAARCAVPRPRLDEQQPHVLSGVDGITVELSILLERRGFNESNCGDPPAGLFSSRQMNVHIGAD
jgi:hypothetical protein